MYKNITAIKTANKALGHCWFSPDSMQFFKSRVLSNVYGGHFFVTSECGPSEQRRYTVRVAMPDGSIDTYGDFQQFGTADVAKYVALWAGKVATAFDKLKPIL